MVTIHWTWGYLLETWTDCSDLSAEALGISSATMQVVEKGLLHDTAVKVFDRNFSFPGLLGILSDLLRYMIYPSCFQTSSQTLLRSGLALFTHDMT
jgi:hypothetical protein